jgi:hypothetical protein
MPQRSASIWTIRGPASWCRRRAPGRRTADLAHLLERAVEQAHGLREVEDVDAVAGGEDEPSHVGVPATGLVAEVNSSLQHLAHADASSHGYLSPPADA